MGLSSKDIEKRNLRGIRAKVDGLGRIMIPKPLREVLGMNHAEYVDIFLLEDGYFVRVPNDIPEDL